MKKIKSLVSLFIVITIQISMFVVASASVNIADVEGKVILDMTFEDGATQIGTLTDFKNIGGIEEDVGHSKALKLTTNSNFLLKTSEAVKSGKVYVSMDYRAACHSKQLQVFPQFGDNSKTNLYNGGLLAQTFSNANSLYINSTTNWLGAVYSGEVGKSKYSNLTYVLDLSKNKIDVYHDGVLYFSQLDMGVADNFQTMLFVICEGGGVNGTKDSGTAEYWLDNIKVIHSAPVAYDVKILGEFTEDGTLTADYKINYSVDTPDNSEIQWYMADLDSSEYTPIAGEINKTIETNKYLDKRLKFTVTPIIGEDEGSPVDSDVIAKISAPFAKNVRVSRLGDEKSKVLTVDYDYFDANGDEKAEERYVWYECDKDGNILNDTPVSESKDFDTETKDCEYVKVGVIPVAINAPYEPEAPTFSEVVNVARALVSYENYVLNMDFEEADVTSDMPKSISPGSQYKSDGEIGTLNITGGDGAVIAIDGNHGKALKIGSLNSFWFNTTQALTEGIVKVSFDYRVENHSTWFWSFPVIGSSDAGFLSSFWCYVENTVNTMQFGGGRGTTIGSFTNARNDYVNMTIIADLDNLKADVINNGVTYKDLPLNSQTNLAKVGFYSDPEKVASSNGSDSGDAIYWIDNVKVYYSLPTAYNAKVLGDFVEDGTLTADYEIAYSEDTPDNSEIQWYMAELDSDNFTLISGETGKTLSTNNYLDKKIKFRVTPIIGEEEGRFVESNVVVKEAVPVAENVRIVRLDAENPDMLTAQFDFYDANGDKPGNSIYKWYVCDKDGNIINTTPVCTTKDYVWDSKTYEYVKVGVTPVSKRDPNEGAVEVFSDVIIAPEPPVVTGIKIVGTAKINEVLSVEYNYSDRNGDAEGTHLYEWYRSSSKDGKDLQPIGTAATYKITEDDIDMYIFVKMTPASVFGNEKGEPDMCDDPFVAPRGPEAENVKIVGTAKVGNTLTGSYDYVHYYNVLQSGTTFRWLMSSSNSVINAAVVGTSSALKLTDNHEGKYIFFEVTPKAVEAPYGSTSFISGGVYIEKSSNIVSISGGGSSFGGSSYRPSTLPVVKPADTVTKVKFTDIDGHWANAEIKWAFEKGIVKGMTETTFAPDATLTSAQFLALILRNIGTTAKETAGDKWYSEYVSEGKKLGIIGDDFEASKELPRAEMAEIIVKAYEYKTGTKLAATTVELTDCANVDEKSLSYIYKAMNKGLLNGMGDKLYSPDTITTRAQSVIVIKRMYDFLGEAK